MDARIKTSFIKSLLVMDRMHAHLSKSDQLSHQYAEERDLGQTSIVLGDNVSIESAAAATNLVLSAILLYDKI